jgi:hypothetical protein
MTHLTRDQILAAQDLKTEDVPVPEWGGTVRLREMSAADIQDWLDGKSGDAGADAMASLLAASIVGEDGARLFAMADFAALKAKNGNVLRRLFDVAKRLNGIAPGQAEDLEKN